MPIHDWSRVDEVLSDMPAYLDVDSYVPVPLESAYQQTCMSCPEIMCEIVLTGRVPEEIEEE